MRILVMGKYPSWYERAYGGEAHAQRLFEEMGELGYEIIIANYVFSGEANGITWKKISNFNFDPLWHTMPVPSKNDTLNLVKETKPEIIHALGKNGYSAAVLKERGRIDLPIVTSMWTDRVSAEGLDNTWKLLIKFHLFQWLAVKMEQKTMQHSEIVVTHCNSMKESLAKTYSIHSNKIVVIYRGAELNEFGIKPYPKESNIIFCAARLEKNKGQDILIKSMPKILKSVPDAELWLAGEGADGRVYRKLTKELGIQDSVKFLGKVPHSEIPELMSKCNIYAHPSVWEPFGASIIEAQACGRVTVVTNTGGNPEIVINDETGYLLESNIDLFVDKITMLLLDKDKAKNMSENARKKIEERFSWEKEARGYINLYHALSNNKRR